MATPTEAECKTIISNQVKYLDEVRKFGHVNAANQLGLEDTLDQSLEGDFNAEIRGSMAGIRGATAAILNQNGMGRDLLYWGWRTYARQQEFPEVDIDGIFNRFYDAYIAGSKSVQTRAFTFGSPAAGGGNVGTGLMHRLKKDENNLDMEAQTADDKICKCIGDSRMGEPLGQELFELYGETRLKDDIQITGSGARTDTLRALSCIDTQAKGFGNPSFDNFGGTAGTPTSIADWSIEVGTIATDIIFDGSVYYRTFQGAGTPYAVKFLSNARLAQSFASRNAVFSRGNPVYVQCAINRNGTSTDGVFTLTFGGVTATVADLTAIAASGWVIVRVTVGSSNWLKAFNATSPYLKVALSSNTTGDLWIDDVIVGEYTPFDGDFYAVVGGATAFKFDDSFTFGDTEVGAKVQTFCWRHFRRYLPHSGAPTFADPA